jgi:carbonic anhydrase/acetyltransferase-like protein (isoleucine patch superfamily)
MGAPARVRRAVTDEERRELPRLAESYVGYKDAYQADAAAVRS